MNKKFNWLSGLFSNSPNSPGRLVGNRRGQVALEFIFIVLLIVLYIFTVTKPLIESSQGMAEDIETVTRANSEAQKVVNSVKRISMLGDGSKETLQLFVPKNAEINCYPDGNFGFVAKINQRTTNGLSINPQVPLCPNDLCDKNFGMPKGLSINCGFEESVTGTTKIFVQKDIGIVSIISEEG